MIISICLLSKKVRIQLQDEEIFVPSCDMLDAKTVFLKVVRHSSKVLIVSWYRNEEKSVMTKFKYNFQSSADIKLSCRVSFHFARCLFRLEKNKWDGIVAGNEKYLLPYSSSRLKILC